MVAIVVLAGCGGGGGLELGGLPGWCPSSSDVTALAGTEVASAGGSGGVGDAAGGEYESTGCVYRLAATADGTEPIVRINRLRREQPGLFDAIVEPSRNPDFPRPFEPIAGLGQDARLDGEELVVLTPGAIVFVEVLLAAGETLDPVAAATLVATAVFPLGLVAGTAPDCATLAPTIVGVLGPLNSNADLDPRPREVEVGNVRFEALGCRFDLDTEGIVTVQVADPAQWDAWVQAKQVSGARSRFVELDVEGRQAVHLVGALVVDDQPEPLWVETQGITGTDDELDRLRLALAELVLDD
jgi:hypothetical protein